MARTRLKAKGRRGGEVEHFARLPESVLQHPALATAPHAALRVLAILVCGYSEQQNGSMMLSASYAATFGFNSHDTLTNSLRLLESRGLIQMTRRVQRLKRFGALYGVTWWPNWYRDGIKLDQPEPATRAYDSFVPLTGIKSEFPSSRSPGYHVPLTGMKDGSHHPDLTPFQDPVHPAHRANSRYLDGGAPRGTASTSAEPSKPEGRNRGRPKIDRAEPSELNDQVRKLRAAMPGQTDAETARLLGVTVDQVREVLA